SYFLHKGEARGFEYEFFKKFAQEHGLSVEVVIVQDGQNPIDLLNSGKGDVIAANYAITKARKKYVDFTKPYNLVNEVVVLPDSDGQAPNNISGLGDITITVRRNSSYYQTLERLKKKFDYDYKIKPVSSGWDTEALMLGVQQGSIPATVADDNLYEAGATYMDGLQEGPTIEKQDTVAWAIRKNSPELKKAMNEYLAKNFKLRGLDNPPKRSAFLNVLRKRYFKNANNMYAFSNPTSSKYSGILSPYDKLIKPIADSMNVNWKMIVAIAAQESKFDPSAKSWAGAVGLMQVSPRFTEYTPQQLENKKLNVREGIRILKEQLKHYAYMDSTNQWDFALATYNAGPGHIADARRLVMDQYRNPNKWSNAARALLMLMKRKYYKNARYGFCRGIETVEYVDDIMNRYKMYQTILALANEKHPKVNPAVLGMGRTIN
ncbi:MAG TPA: transporter substrate-binding domain-containing protein, partial [Balneolales bacterium]|nr:transporter substrate-binding domain-containing protein [Balneolales bacterium]